jgi:hypothetical protein
MPRTITRKKLVVCGRLECGELLKPGLVAYIESEKRKFWCLPCPEHSHQFFSEELARIEQVNLVYTSPFPRDPSEYLNRLELRRIQRHPVIKTLEELASKLSPELASGLYKSILDLIGNEIPPEFRGDSVRIQFKEPHDNFSGLKMRRVDLEIVTDQYDDIQGDRFHGAILSSQLFKELEQISAVISPEERTRMYRAITSIVF